MSTDDFLESTTEIFYTPLLIVAAMPWILIYFRAVIQAGVSHIQAQPAMPCSVSRRAFNPVPNAIYRRYLPKLVVASIPRKHLNGFAGPDAVVRHVER